MLFTELRFLPFFLLVFAVHWGLRRERERKGWLLLCSYFFYGVWDWRFLSLILISTLVDYIAALRVGNEKRSRGWLLVSLGVNLGLLAIFKYFGFFLESAYDLLHLVGVTLMKRVQRACREVTPDDVRDAVLRQLEQRG